MPETILRHFCDRLLANLKIDYGPHLLRSGHFERYGDVTSIENVADFFGQPNHPEKRYGGSLSASD
jgi:hypothetical protein